MVVVVLLTNVGAAGILQTLAKIVSNKYKV